MSEPMPQEVLKATTKCPRNFSCLNNNASGSGPECNCRVESFLGKNLLFVRPKENKTIFCPYLMHYGNEYICQCPTHYHHASQRKQ